ncbi:MAG TPA: hypothetical protein VFM51_06150 [Solirubrobacterales bacterium]|nr:hypothetical protein [Solirubrobacterales bacterium]
MARKVEYPEGASNAMMRAIRIYGSESRWGDDLRWSPPEQPFKSHNFPRDGWVGRVFVGAVPAEICGQIQARQAFANAFLQRQFGGASSLDAAAEEALKSEPMPVYDDHAWYVTLVIDSPCHLPENPESDSAYLSWDGASAAKVDEDFRSTSDHALNALAAQVGMAIEPMFFETRVSERDFFLILAENRPVSVFPRLSGSAKASIGKSADNFPATELQDRLEGLGGPSRQIHHTLRQAVGWWTASLSMDNNWQRFQAAFLALELFVGKMAPRYRSEVLDRLEFGGLGNLGASLSELVISEDVKPMPLAARFAVVALALDPENASRDLAEFKAAKKARDGLAHGAVLPADDLPVGQIGSLARKYLDLGLRRQMPPAAAGLLRD